MPTPNDPTSSLAQAALKIAETIQQVGQAASRTYPLVALVLFFTLTDCVKCMMKWEPSSNLVDWCDA